MGSTRASDSFLRFLSRPMSLVGFAFASVPYLHELVRPLLETRDEAGDGYTFAAVSGVAAVFVGVGVSKLHHRARDLVRIPVALLIIGLGVGGLALMISSHFQRVEARRAAEDRQREISCARGEGSCAGVDDETKLTRQREACDEGVSPACLASGLELLKRGPAERDNALELLKKACALKSGEACLRVAQSIEDRPTAFPWFERACAANNGLGCFEVGVTVRNKNDPGPSMKAFEAGCDAGELAACRELGVAYANGAGVEVNLDRAIELFERSCPSFAIACSNLALALSMEGKHQDLVRARAMYDRACGAHYAPGCTGLGQLYDQGLGGAQDDAKAFKLFEQACAADDFRGCLFAGLCLRDGEGTAVNKAEAIARLEKACDGEATEACDHLGVLLASVDRERAAGVLKKSCARGTEASCRELKKLGSPRK